MAGDFGIGLQRNAVQVYMRECDEGAAHEQGQCHGNARGLRA